MDTLSAFAMGAANRNKPCMVFDWDKAARLIKERQPHEASAGLAGDWEYTGGAIWRDGKPLSEDDTYVYLASTWATPELDLDGEKVDCFIMEDVVPKEWGGDHAKIYWPDSARSLVSV